MKLFILTFPVLILLILFTHKSVAQCPIPNAGFENWTDGDLDNWDELEVMEALETHSGNSAAQLLRGPVGIFPSFLLSFLQNSRVHKSQTILMAISKQISI